MFYIHLNLKINLIKIQNTVNAEIKSTVLVTNYAILKLLIMLKCFPF